MKTTHRIVFAGTPRFAVPSLEALIAHGYDVRAVYTQPDKPYGRGKRGQARPLQASPVKQAALGAGIPVVQPVSLRSEQAVTELARWQPDLMIVVAYGQILPPAILSLPTIACINVHASLLPRWRGAAPIQRAIQAGDTQTGISIMQMDTGLDTGPVYHRARCALSPTHTAGQLHDQLAELGAHTLLETLPGILDGTLSAVEQDHQRASYAAKIAKSEAVIDWHDSAPVIARQVRAFYPWPIAHTRIADEATALRILSAEVLVEACAATGPAQSLPCGTVIAESRFGIQVLSGDGILNLLTLQLPGGRALSAEQFLNGRSLLGKILGGEPR